MMFTDNDPRCRSPPPSVRFSHPIKNRNGGNEKMATINLRDFYPWYTHDEFVDVPDVIAGELFADKRYEKIHKQRIRRNKAIYSLDAEDGIEASATVHPTNSPDAVMEKKEQRCRICCALNSLPEIQGRRVDAHYLVGKSRREIAAAEGVSESAVNAAIEKGLTAMKKYLINYRGGGCQMSSK
jgi:RNA polymerase sigma-70 factor (ECF subfamily)